jgi:hypothetical protein
MNRIAIDTTSAVTPCLLMTDHRIAYGNRKYHSGYMCIGVTSEFAATKLSRCPRMYGSFNDIVDSAANRIINPYNVSGCEV